MPDSQNLAIKKRAPIARCLFGRPDPNSTWLRDRLNEMRQQEEKKWNFDFINDRPLTSSSTNECSSSNWEYTAVSADALPSFYHPKVCIIPRKKKKQQRQPVPSSDDTRLESSPSPLLLNTDLLSSFIDESSAGLIHPATMDTSQPKITAYFGLSRSRKRQHSRSVLKKDMHPSALSTSNRLLL